MRVIAARCMSLWRRPNRMNFSWLRGRSGEPPNGYEDWEYCQKIAQQLKKNNVESALSLLFQSYFHHKVLDIQIYNKIFEKISLSYMPLSYAEILYELYRQDFPPHPLLILWMNKLTQSKNQQMIAKLKQDYETLNQPYPNRNIKIPKIQSIRKGQKSEYLAAKNKQKKQSKKSHIKPRFQIPSTSDQSININNIDHSKMSPEQLFRIKLATQLNDILLQLNISQCQHTRVKVHGLKVEFHEHQLKEELDLPPDEEYQYQDRSNQFKNFYGMDMNKIRIARIEFNSKTKKK